MKYEIIVHGVDHSQYFQGCGSGCFEWVTTGIGDNAKEAYEDALDTIAQNHRRSAEHLPTKPRGIRKSDRVKAHQRGEDIWFWVSIRYDLDRRDLNECDQCGAIVPWVIGCPDGAEVCRPCFDSGAH